MNSIKNYVLVIGASLGCLAGGCSKAPEEDMTTKAGPRPEYVAWAYRNAKDEVLYSMLVPKEDSVKRSLDNLESLGKISGVHEHDIVFAFARMDALDAKLDGKAEKKHIEEVATEMYNRLESRRSGRVE